MTKYPTHYGRWWGNPTGVPADPLRCVKAVPGAPSWRLKQCGHKRGHGPDGAYCKQHDPDARAAKRAAQAEKWRAEFEARMREHAIERASVEAIRLIAEGHDNPRALAQWALDGGKDERP